MAKWVRFESGKTIQFGTLEGDVISIHEGNMFDSPKPSGEQVNLADVTLLTPCEPSKMFGLWNNFHALAAKLGNDAPEEPLYFHKSSNAFLAHGGVIQRPAIYSGRVVYEGEIGIVIGTVCKEISEDQAASAIFGYTCINDVTAADIIDKDPTFAQWPRAKSFDTFGPFGPAIGTGLDPADLNIVTILNGDERQNYPVADMIIPPHKIVSMISQEVTLSPGDIICCGTSIGVGVMKQDSNTVSVTIEGVGTLENTFINS
ncbi:MAG: fumarylacetoacetate hydrolase family protein [Rhodospirillales bacterium]|jgi:2-keto-4-pentenoate hydratase/2-oxohepta-3-ene-1,7-dioic acid hydratase in catechol pathway|nr:fumarylacetoacetate hydrolase family protein [Rhodospirillales bacterium]